jgi:preprotein translocase SecE subunit
MSPLLRLKGTRVSRHSTTAALVKERKLTMKVFRGILRPFTLLIEYLRGAYKEFKHVEWPSRQAVVQYTVLVMITIVVGSLVLTAFDYGLKQLTEHYLIR